MIKISIVTPTYNRESFHGRILGCVLTQTHSNWEWLIHDDSPIPSGILSTVADDRIKYFHSQDKLTIGEKRNLLGKRACGEIIIHFDDDDFYCSDYCAKVVNKLETDKLDFINLRGWFVHDLRHGFLGWWFLMAKNGLYYVCDGNGILAVKIDDSEGPGGAGLGWGFGYAYRKAVIDTVNFPPQNFAEDGAFAAEVVKRFHTGWHIDKTGIVLHEVHAGNTSRSFAQYNIPEFLLPKIFPEYVLPV
jgi:glycosyltransferase involved in cell wall biosynthesis